MWIALSHLYAYMFGAAGRELPHILSESKASFIKNRYFSKSVSHDLFITPPCLFLLALGYILGIKSSY